MKRSTSDRPVLSWCLSVRNCESDLLRCLTSLRERTPDAEIVVVDNMSGDGTPEVAKRFADVFISYSGPEGKWTSEDPWTYNMAASRQEGFNAASGRWIGWIDSDDVLRNPQETERLLKLNGRWKPSGSRVEGSEKEIVQLEELLLRVEKDCPEATCIWAPYLYAKDIHGHAYTWQDRERFIKKTDPPLWHWQEAAHEILVPVKGYEPKKRVDFAHLLFVHTREMSDENYLYSVRRHFDVLIKQYNEGDVTTRRCLYLAAYSLTLCPDREREFIDAAHNAATTHVERSRSLSLLGQMYVRHGLMNDALEALGAATELRPDLPDAWLIGGETWHNHGDYGRAIQWLERGIACSITADSYVNPRHHIIRFPFLLANSYEKFAMAQREIGNHEDVQRCLGRAVELLKAVKENPAIGEDYDEAFSRSIFVHNQYLAQINAISLSRAMQYLIDNDEPAKALELLKIVPWNLQDHPLMVAYELKLRHVKKHIEDPKAYVDFYASDVETGYVETPSEWISGGKCIGRAKWISEWINKNIPDAFVLDVGCFDGIVGLPVIERCPGIKYVGVDVYEKPVERFKERLKERKISDRAEVKKIPSIESFAVKPDVVIWSEVIEHVVDPVKDLRRILSFLSDGGVVLVTTPWGAFDAGHPSPFNCNGGERDSRGHLRVVTAQDMDRIASEAGCDIEDLHHSPSATGGPGDELRAVIRKRGPRGNPVSFVVPSALWDWNGRSLDEVGMGASEKSIVQFGSALAGERRVDVYGPVPDDDVYKNVRYWAREKMRHINGGKIVVSRSPGYYSYIREMVPKRLPMILWLQDAYYPDLNAKVAEEYEKIVVVSEWHKQAMHDLHQVPLEKMEVIYNPVDAALDLRRGGEVGRQRVGVGYLCCAGGGVLPRREGGPQA